MKRSIAQLSILLVLSTCGAPGGPVSIKSVSPSKGSGRGGELVVISGSGFGTSPTVKFGGVEAELSTAYDNEVRVRSPRHPAGPVVVEVEANGVRARLDAGYTFESIPVGFVDVSWKQLAPLVVNGAGVDVAGGVIFQTLRYEGVAIYGRDGGVSILLPPAPLVDAGVDAGIDAGPGDAGVDGGKPDAGTVDAGKPDAGALDAGPGDGGVDAGVFTGPPSDLVTVLARDFDRDGRVDLFLGASNRTPPRLIFGAANGEWIPAVLPASWAVDQTATASDLDGDGDLDLVLTGSADNSMGTPHVALWMNDGARKFTDATQRIAGAMFDATSVTAGDVDGDGQVDLFFTGFSEQSRLYLGDGRGSFLRASPDAVPVDPAIKANAAALGDLNGDGKADLYLACSTFDRVWINDGTGRFRDLTGTTLGTKVGAGFRVVLADVDLDAALDAVVIDRPGKLRLFRNDGKGRMFDYSNELPPADARLVNGGLAVSDVDGDGDDDLIVSRDDVGRAALILNWGPKSVSDEDPDLDKVPSPVDSCPMNADPQQLNRDSLPFGCESNAICKAERGCELRVRGGQAYLFCFAPAETWDGAAAACRAKGGELVTINDPAENAFLTSPVTLWIGFHDHAVEGAFEWVADPTNAYTRWGAGQPDNSNNEDCTTLLDAGIWNDDNCATKYGYLCETPRLRAPDPGDVCDNCPAIHEPGSPPVTSDAGSCFMPDAGADGGTGDGGIKDGGSKDGG